MKTLVAFGVAGLMAAGTLAAQQPTQNTEVFLVSLTASGTTLTASAPKNISNSPGYDNQPSWLADASAILFTSNRDGKQTDIYKFDVKTAAVAQLTHTDENEYSALVASDGASFTTVHGAEQSIYRYDMDGSHPRPAYQHGKSLIGYYIWTTPTDLAAFVLGANGAPNTLELINTTDGSSDVVASNIGRSLLRRPNRSTISFVSKDDRAHWQIKQVNPTSQTVSDICEALPGVEDMTWLRDGRIISGKDAKLFVWAEGAGWKEFADLSAQGVTRITRVAASPDGKWLALVGEPRP